MAQAALLEPPRGFPDAARFRDAMARMAGGVAIAACWDGGVPRGLLVSSLASLSTEPPRMLFCVRKAAATHAALARAQRCSLSILADDDEDEAERFSRAERAAERFTAPSWRLDDDAAPWHAQAMIGLTGRIGQHVDAGSHSIFILDIEDIRARPVRPLIYFDRGFQKLAAV